VLFIVGAPPPGITTLIILAFLGIGINSLGLGILGEYLGRTYWEVKRRPLYVVRESVNLQVERGMQDYAGSAGSLRATSAARDRPQSIGLGAE